MPDLAPPALIDIGANLGHESFAHDFDAVIERAEHAGIAHLLVTGTSASASRHAVEIAQRKPTLLSATAGVHPHEAQHCDEEAFAQIRELVDLPIVRAVGETGWVCDERRGHHLLEFLKDIPEERLLLETDAPYLLPRSIKPRPKSRRNEPHYLTEVLSTVAQALGRSPMEIAAQTSANARHLFQLPSAS